MGKPYPMSKREEFAEAARTEPLRSLRSICRQLGVSCLTARDWLDRYYPDVYQVRCRARNGHVGRFRVYHDTTLLRVMAAEGTMPAREAAPALGMSYASLAVCCRRENIRWVRRRFPTEAQAEQLALYAANPCIGVGDAARLLMVSPTTLRHYIRRAAIVWLRLPTDRQGLRQAAVGALHTAGWNYQQIGAAMGFSREWARRLAARRLRKHGQCVGA
jgi:hypothetical protein